jgi:SRSO17 transposase
VHLGYVGGGFHALVDSDVYLPEAWLADRARCREAGIPDGVVYRPKWRIALDILKHTLGNGVHLKYLTADEEYGRCGSFRAEVDALGLLYVVEVPCALKGWTQRPRVLGPWAGSTGLGRPRTKPELAAGARLPRRVDRLWKRGGPSWRGFHVKNTDKGPVVWEARTTRFSPWTKGGLPGEEIWLIVARNVLDGEVKYFLSNAPADTPVELLLHVAFSRDHVEKLFEESKGEVGLDHFEVRGYRAVKRHLVLSMVSLLFLAEQTQALRGEKSVVESLPGPSGHRSATGP